MAIRILVIGLLMFCSAGCCEGHWNLLSLSASRQEMAEEVAASEASYLRLKNDVLNNRLKKGTRRKKLISEYGEPGLAKPDFFLYCNPAKGFSSDLIYLRFDKKGKLSSWEVKSAK